MGTSFTLKVLGIFFVASLLLMGGCGKPNQPWVQVKRDAYNAVSIRVAYVPSPSQDPNLILFEEQGYQEAKDRFLQMDILRRRSLGMLSELFAGSEEAERQDRRALGVGLPQASERSSEKVREASPDAWAGIESFSKGVNRYIDEMERLNPEVLHTLRSWTRDAQYLPLRWEPLHAVSIATGMAFYLSSCLEEKIIMGYIALNYYEKNKFPDFLRLMDYRPTENEFILGPPKNIKPPSESLDITGLLSLPNLLSGSAVNRSVDLKCNERSYPFHGCDFSKGVTGSNNWVVSNKFAGSTKSYVANDPHIPLSYPTAFYPVALDSTPAGGSFKVRGVNLPGVPGILVGHNRDLAWGLTNQAADVDDIYLEAIEIDDKGVGHVSFKGSKVALVHEERILRVRNRNGEIQDKKVTVRWVPHHGPILTDHFPEFEPLTKKFEAQFKKQLAGSYRWVGHRGTTEVIAVRLANEAKTLSELKEGVQRYFQVGSQNWVAADLKGDIRYFSPGLFPQRKYLDGFIGLPNIPVLCGLLDLECEWEEEFRKDFPELENPENGRIVTANNDPYGHTLNMTGSSGFDDYFGSYFATGARAARIVQALEEKRGNLTLKDNQSIQNDATDLTALRYIRLIGESLDKHPEKFRSLSTEALQIVRRLRAWDGKALRDREEPILFDSLLRSLARVYFKELENLLPSGVANSTLVTSAVVVKTLYHKLNDGLNSPTKKTQEGVIQWLARSLNDTVELAAPKPRRWGQVNRLKLSNILEGILPSIASLPIERDGSPETPNVANGPWAPHFRIIMELEESKPIEAHIVMAGGNYTDILENGGWRKELLEWRDNIQHPLIEF